MPTPAGANARRVAADVAMAVLDQGMAADVAMTPHWARMEDPKDRALTRRLVHDLMRDWPMCDALVGALLSQALKRRDRRVHFVLAIALAELRLGREPDHAVVHSAVEATRAAKSSHLAKLVNAVLRRYLRDKELLERDLDQTLTHRYGYPQWLITRVQTDWPTQWADILDAGNAAPPLTLRVNRRHWSRDRALVALHQSGIEAHAVPALPDAVMCEHRVAIRDLPQFEVGAWSVQDASAQWATEWLQLQPSQRVLDACAGPGGKAAYILEREDVHLVAVESEADRLTHVEEGLSRLGLSAELICADATALDDWWDGQLFDRILIDAPCSATGVIRRHPDIRWLRQEKDVASLATLQQALLERLWSALQPGCILVYITCSVLAQENQQQIQHFLENTKDAQAIEPPNMPEPVPGRALSVGWQVLPGESDWDGFYFAGLRRLPAV